MFNKAQRIVLTVAAPALAYLVLESWMGTSELTYYGGSDWAALYFVAGITIAIELVIWGENGMRFPAWIRFPAWKTVLKYTAVTVVSLGILVIVFIFINDLQAREQLSENERIHKNEIDALEKNILAKQRRIEELETPLIKPTPRPLGTNPPWMDEYIKEKELRKRAGLVPRAFGD